MRRLIYWGRPRSGEEDEARSKRVAELLRDCIAATDIFLDDWSDLPGDAAFFDRLDRMPFDEIDDGVIVVLDRCDREDFAFSPIGLFDVRSSAVSQRRKKAGAASALILRYPTIWPVFINAGTRDAAVLFEDAISQMFQEVANVLPKADSLRDAMDESLLIEFSSFTTAQHFITDAELASAAESKTLPQVFHAPVLGALAAFDPTGLRTFTKARLLNELLVKEGSTSSAKPSREREAMRAATKRAIANIVERLRQPAVVVEEEEDFAYLGAYSAYRHGRRVWTVTNFKFFRDGVWRDDLAWADPKAGGSGLVLRDFDLRFVDLPTGDKRDLTRVDQWRCDQDDDAGINTWIARACWRTCSSYSAVHTPMQIRAEKLDAGDLNVNWRSGMFTAKVRNGKRGAAAPETVVLVGARKPITNILFVTSDLEDGFAATGSPAPRQKKGTRWTLSYRTLLARWDLRSISSGSDSRHAPPPVNLEVASGLLERVRALRAGNQPRASLHAAVMALEAYELLMGKSQSTSMEALQQVYLAETELETRGIGLSSRLELAPKAQDIAFALNNFFGSDDIDDIKREQDYAAKIWSGVRTIFRAADMFQAANDANIAVLTNQRWIGAREFFWRIHMWLRFPFSAFERSPEKRRLLRRSRMTGPRQPDLDKHAWARHRARLFVRGSRTFVSAGKQLMAKIATDPGEWLKAFFGFWVGASVLRTVGVAIIVAIKRRTVGFSDFHFFTEASKLLTASLSSQFQNADDETVGGAMMRGLFWFFDVSFLAVNTVMMAFLIAMIVRQVTRD